MTLSWLSPRPVRCAVRVPSVRWRNIPWVCCWCFARILQQRARLLLGSRLGLLAVLRPTASVARWWLLSWLSCHCPLPHVPRRTRVLNDMAGNRFLHAPRGRPGGLALVLHGFDIFSMRRVLICDVFFVCFYGDVLIFLGDSCFVWVAPASCKLGPCLLDATAVRICPCWTVSLGACPAPHLALPQGSAVPRLY